MENSRHSLAHLCQQIKESEHRLPLTFQEFLERVAAKPQLIFRNVFQVFYDMITSHVGEGIDEYPDDPESINYVYYDTTTLFVEGTDHPFFADRLFANRLVKHIVSFRRGTQQNRIYIFEGPHGCGKSTFLNNLLMKFEQYTKTDVGTSYETVWRLNKKDLGVGSDRETHYLLTQLRSLVDPTELAPHGGSRENMLGLSHKGYIEVPCPSHDNPVLLIPKSYRREALDGLIEDPIFKHRLFSEKQYEWVFRDQPCTICMSLYQTLLEQLDSPAKVFDMLYARRYQFNKRLGQGISVFNPGDSLTKVNVLTNPTLQNQLNALLRDSNKVRYLYSRYANTNNGIYALMDVKACNKDRFANLHGIISEGVHKVEDIEETVNSLFLALMNPEDQEVTAGTQSFTDRITTIKIPYVLDYNTEVKIYKNVFGEHIERYFLPRVLQNFAKVIIASRLKPQSEGLQEWIADPGKYTLYCDHNLQLLKMDIYAGLIPPWLSEEDRKDFTAKRRRRLIAESETEGDKGFSGRDSLKLFSELYSTYAKKDRLITMATVCNYFRKHHNGEGSPIPEGFLESLVHLYNYTVLEEVKESLYDYNEDRISREIQNYLFAVNFEIGCSERCLYTGEDLEITEDFLLSSEHRLLGPNADMRQCRSFRADVQRQYTAKTLTQEMLLDGQSITQTGLYQSLHERYVHNLKENVMNPFLKNDNFRSAIKDYATDGFKSYDARIREDVTMLMQNLNKKYGYTQQGAKEVCIYVVDNHLARTYSKV